MIAAGAIPSPRAADCNAGLREFVNMVRSIISLPLGIRFGGKASARIERTGAKSGNDLVTHHVALLADLWGNATS